MSSRQLLVVRALGLQQAQSELGATDFTPDDLPAPITGFRLVAGPWVLAAFRGVDCVCVAPFAQSELRMLGHDVAHGAMIGPVRRTHRIDEPTIDEAYRAFVDYIVSTSAPPSVISVGLRAGEESAVEVLQHIAAAIEGRAVVHRGTAGTRVDIVRTGGRAAIASLLSAGWRVPEARLTIRDLLRAPRRRSQPDRKLVVLARGVREPAARVDVSVPVSFAEATATEILSHPLRFGLRLYTNGVDPAIARLFVGRVDGVVVFRMAFNFSAPVLDRLVLPAFGDSLAAPVALVSQCATEPGFRGRSIYPAALRWVAEWGGAHGVRSVVLLVERGNTASLKGAAKAGFRRLGVIATQR